MASKNEETKKVSTKKTNNTKKTTTKTSTKKTTSNKTTTTKKTSTSKTTPKKTTTKNTISKNTTKKSTPKKVEKELEKTIIIEDIENKISDIVKNKNVEVNEEVIENGAKLENAKYRHIKKNKHLLAIGVVISILGIIALIITLIANRIVDKEFISDNTIIIMIFASILIEIFGAFIIINES